MFGGGFFWLYALILLEAVLVLVAVGAVFVMLFMTGRRARDPRGVLPATAFALSVTFAGLMAHIVAWGAIAAALGMQAGSTTSCSVGSQQLRALRDPLNPARSTLPTFSEPDFSPPENVIVRPDGSTARLVLCGGGDDSARRVASTIPYLIASGAALGGGSRMFRRLLNEERAHDRA